MLGGLSAIIPYGIYEGFKWTPATTTFDAVWMDPSWQAFAAACCVGWLVGDLTICAALEAPLLGHSSTQGGGWDSRSLGRTEGLRI
jgi:hypothetical protein